jgi:hypothetical protein
MVKGSSLAASAVTVREKIEIKMFKWGLAASSSEVTNTYLTIKRSRVHILLLPLSQ